MEERRNYKHVFDAFGRIIKSEGVLALWKGAVPTMARAMALNCALLVTYEEAKERISKKMGPGANPFKVQAIASMISACATSVCSLPFDNVKTKLQKQKPDAEGNVLYKNFADCFRVTIAREGVTGLWAGLPTYYFRVGPHAIVSLMAVEKLRLVMGVK
jgi:solute carrier family 25 oxoglutarate transporter 11